VCERPREHPADAIAAVRLLCGANLPYEAAYVAEECAAHGRLYDTLDESTRALAFRSRRQAAGVLHPQDFVLNANPGPIPSYVASSLAVKVRSRE
jgi:hypothetical protein